MVIGPDLGIGGGSNEIERPLPETEHDREMLDKLKDIKAMFCSFTPSKEALLERYQITDLHSETAKGLIEYREAKLSFEDQTSIILLGIKSTLEVLDSHQPRHEVEHLIVELEALMELGNVLLQEYPTYEQQYEDEDLIEDQIETQKYLVNALHDAQDSFKTMVLRSASKPGAKPSPEITAIEEIISDRKLEHLSKTIDKLDSVHVAFIAIHQLPRDKSSSTTNAKDEESINTTSDVRRQPNELIGRFKTSSDKDTAGKGGTLLYRQAKTALEATRANRQATRDTDFRTRLKRANLRFQRFERKQAKIRSIYQILDDINSSNIADLLLRSRKNEWIRSGETDPLVDISTTSTHSTGRGLVSETIKIQKTLRTENPSFRQVRQSSLSKEPAASRKNTRRDRGG